MMQNIKDVIHALECCFDVQSGWKDRVWVCPACLYAKNDGQPCETLAPLLDDAIALLKAQQPRVLTLDEAKEALRKDPVICIEGDGKMIYGVRMDGTDYFTMQTDEVMNIDDLNNEEFAAGYGTVFRMWKR